MPSIVQDDVEQGAMYFQADGALTVVLDKAPLAEPVHEKDSPKRDLCHTSSSIRARHNLISRTPLARGERREVPRPLGEPLVVQPMADVVDIDDNTSPSHRRHV